MTTPRRRWLRFSLRTLFVVVTVVCCWLGYYIHWQDERSEALTWLGALDVGGSIGYTPEPRPALPWMLKLLGERPQEQLFMMHGGSTRFSQSPPAEYRRLVERVKRLFPEAQVVDISIDFPPEDNSPNDDSPATQADRPK